MTATTFTQRDVRIVEAAGDVVSKLPHRLIVDRDEATRLEYYDLAARIERVTEDVHLPADMFPEGVFPDGLTLTPKAIDRLERWAVVDAFAPRRCHDKRPRAWETGSSEC